MLSVPDFPVILSFGNIANFLECIAVFNFVKRLSALRIVAKPFTDRFPLSDSFAIFLHYVLDVCCFGRGKERLVALRAETDNRIYGSLKDLVCLVENVGKHLQNMPARFQRTLQQTFFKRLNTVNSLAEENCFLTHSFLIHILSVTFFRYTPLRSNLSMLPAQVLKASKTNAMAKITNYL